MATHNQEEIRHGELRIERPPQPTTTSDTNCSKNNPLENLRKALFEGFCSPAKTSNVDNGSNPDHGPNSMRKYDSTGVSSRGTNPLDSIQKVLQGFCDPAEQSRSIGAIVANEHSPPSASPYQGHCLTDRLLNVKSNDRDDDETDEEDESDKDTVVVVTKPGEARSFRILRGLETFLAAVLLFFATLYLLHRMGENLGFEIQAYNQNEGTNAAFAVIPRNNVV